MSAEAPSSATVEERLSLLALGGLLLSGFALIGASATFLLSFLSPTPLVLLFPFIFGPLALAGGALGLVGQRRARRGRRRGASLGWAAAGCAALTVFLLLPLAVLFGLPRFRAFQLESRHAQALHFLSQIRMGAMSHRFESPDFSFPEGDSGWVPEDAPSSVRYPYEAALWTVEPWVSLDFAPSAAHFHQYRYRSLDGGRGFVVSARGDLDGDGECVVLTSTVRAGPDGRVTLSGPTRVPEDAR